MRISEELKSYIKKNFKKGKVVCLTGAGISAESGIPTFRGKGGLWEKYDPEIYANSEGLISLLRTNPKKLANFITDFYSVLLPAWPNPAHIALAKLEKEGILSSVITQNIDNLHQEAGSHNVIELHGNSFRLICMNCQRRLIFDKRKITEMLDLIKQHQNSYVGILKTISQYFPRCKCGGRFRIDIVLFGELLPQDELSRAYEELDKCGTFLIIGSSLVVHPAAVLPIYAKQRGVKLIEINSQPSSLSQICDYRVIDSASRIIPEFLHLI